MYIVPALKSEFRAHLGYIGILSVKMIKLCFSLLCYSFPSLQVNALLPTETFIYVIRGLVGNPLPSVRRKALDLLNNKLQQNALWKKKMVSEDPFPNPHPSVCLLQSCLLRYTV